MLPNPAPPATIPIWQQWVNAKRSNVQLCPGPATEFVRWISQYLFACLRNLGAPAQDFEDLVHVTFADLNKYHGVQANTEGAVVKLFLVAVSRTYIDHARKQKRTPRSQSLSSVEGHPKSGSMDIPGDTPSPDEEAMKTERAQVLRDAILQLKPRYLAVGTLMLQGKGPKEISAQLRRPLGTIKTQVAIIQQLLRANKRLRDVV